MLAGEREQREGESFVLKSVSPFPPVPRFGAAPITVPPITNENEQEEADATKEKEPEAMDSGSNLPVLAPGDAGQSNSVGGANTDSSSSGFVAVDVGALSSLASEVGPPDAAASPRPPRTPKVVRSLSRKGERKPADGDGNGHGNGSAGGGGGERPQIFVHVAPGDLGDATGARLVVHTPVAGTPSGKSRRLGARRPAPWLDPRRVVFLFATLSSVGTLILLYFTLSMSRTDSSGDGAAASDAP